MMYSVSVKSHLFIAHSLDHPDFGPARNVHGATLEVVITVFAKQLNDMNVVTDIGYLKGKLDSIVEKYNYKNLDDLDEFNNNLTTIDFLCKHIFDLIKVELNRVDDNDNELESMKVSIYESSDAWASFKENL